MTITAKNISWSVKQKKILHDVSLKAEPGKHVAIIGPNGAGKTSLLRILAGEFSPKEGAIHYGKNTLSSLSLDELAKTRAVMSQHTEMHFPFTVAQIVAMGRFPHGKQPSKDDYTIMDQMMKACDIYHLRDQNSQTLSGGEQQRMHAARVLTQIWSNETKSKPRYLFLDEPVASLDIHHQLMLLNYLTALKKMNVGIISILHDLNLAARYADKILLLKDGKSFAYGNPKTVLTHENILASFAIDAIVQLHPTRNHPYILAA